MQKQVISSFITSTKNDAYLITIIKYNVGGKQTKESTMSKN
jgi:hypothetical protein